MIDGIHVPIAGVDGCKGGWIAVRADPGLAPTVRIYPKFAALVADLPAGAVVAVDMPIGLPDFTNKGGRGPESLVRPMLGERQSSVFSIPSRAALYAETADFTNIDIGTPRIGAPARLPARPPTRRAASRSRLSASLPRFAR